VCETWSASSELPLSRHFPTAVARGKHQQHDSSPSARDNLQLVTTFMKELKDVNSRVQHPVARVSIGFINVTTVRNYFHLLYY
jgi:hypothetical protein